MMRRREQHVDIFASDGAFGPRGVREGSKFVQDRPLIDRVDSWRMNWVANVTAGGKP